MGNSSYSEVNIQYIVGPLRMAVFGNGLTHELVDHKDSTANWMERAQLVGRSHIKGGIIGIMTGILIQMHHLREGLAWLAVKHSISFFVYYC